MSRRKMLCASAALLPLVVGPAAVAAAASSPGSSAMQRLVEPRSSLLAPYPANSRRGFLPSSIECRLTATPPDTNLDCDNPVLPNDEPHIAVDPADPKHMVASSNDFDSNADEFYTSFDGGQTWVTGNMSLEGPTRVGSDPVTSFDVKHGVVLHSSLNFLFTPDGLGDDGDVVVSRSVDGGRTWARPVVVDGGQGNDLSPTQVFNDKEWITTDNNPHSRYYGRSYLTWSRFLNHSGVYAESPIWLSHSDDGGKTWSRAVEISGSSAVCTFQTQGRPLQCDEDQGSVPVVGPDGTLTVGFTNAQGSTHWEAGEIAEDQYLVVQSRDGGRTWSAPRFVVAMEDGSRDFPVNVNGEPTLTGFQARTPVSPGLAVDPRTGALGMVFFDNRAGRHDVATPVTNTNVYLMTSPDGREWTGPHPVATGQPDQFFPAVDINPDSGDFGILFHQEVGPGRYVTRLATGTPAKGFSTATVSTAVSDSANAVVFRARSGDCPKCTTFFGDYISIAYGRDGAANLVWTDMRREVTLGQDHGHTENIFYARR